MRGIIVFLAVIWLLAQPALTGPALAQPKWAMGQTYSGNIDIGGVQVPLLSGDWTVVGLQSFASRSTSSGSTSGDTQTVAMVQASGKLVRAYMVFAYNQRALSNGWQNVGEAQCSRKEIHHAMVVRDRQTDKSCQYVNHIIYSVGSNAAQWWKDSIDYAQKSGFSMPQISITGGAVVSDRANYIATNYYFNPAVAGFPPPQNTTWENNDWNTINVASDEKKKAFVQSIVDWTGKMRGVVEAGLAGKLKKGEGLDWPTAMQAGL